MTALLLLIPILSFAANNAVNDACKRLCEMQSDCVKKCVGHAELMELRADLINASADFTKKVDDRLTALKTGANLEVFELCKKSGWSLENQFTCLRAYPTPEVMKNCKKISPLQEEQVTCMRNGKTEAQIDACSSLTPGTDTRLRCVGMKVTADDARACGAEGGDTQARMKCLDHKERANNRAALDTRIRAARNIERSRSPASIEQ